MKGKYSYLTISGRSEGQYKEKGSKFIGIALPCTSPELAKKLLSQIEREHHQARHWCYAYRFGLKGDVYRANDDGEPSNSAGAPILGQLQSFEVTNVLVVVVRYYGGTKLGVGGLISAYRTAAKEALNTSEILEREVFEWIIIEFEYNVMVRVMNILKKYRLEMVEKVFELSCKLKTNLPMDSAELIRDELCSLETLEIESIGIY